MKTEEVKHSDGQKSAYTTSQVGLFSKLDKNTTKAPHKVKQTNCYIQGLLHSGVLKGRKK